MRNFNFYQNEIERIANNLPSNIKEIGVSEMLFQSSPEVMDQFELESAEEMFIVMFYSKLEEMFENEEFNNEEYYEKFYEEVVKNSSLYKLSEEIREEAINYRMNFKKK